jgi:putative transposase
LKKTRHTTDQIIEKLRQADVALGKGQKVPEVCKALEITEQTYYRWRQKYGGMAHHKSILQLGTILNRSGVLTCLKFRYQSL